MVLKHLSKKEKELIALCIEFEGSIFIHRTNVRIVIGNTNRKLLDKFKEIVRCGKISVAYLRSNRKPVYFWVLEGSMYPKRKNYRYVAYHFYKEIFPYLITKQIKHNPPDNPPDNP